MTRWLHYIGGFYTPEKFIRESRKHGVNRKVAPNMAGAFEYGDTVVLLEWLHAHPRAFAEFTIQAIRFPAEITQAIGEKLVEQGKATIREGGGLVVRECGSYIDGGGYGVDESVKLSDLVKQAKDIAKEKGIELSFFIGGPLTKVYEPAFVVQPYPPFTRGFIRVKDETLWESDLSGVIIEHKPDPQMRGMTVYQKRKNKVRKDIQMKLIVAPA